MYELSFIMFEMQYYEGVYCFHLINYAIRPTMAGLTIRRHCVTNCPEPTNNSAACCLSPRLKFPHASLDYGDCCWSTTDVTYLNEYDKQRRCNTVELSLHRVRKGNLLMSIGTWLLKYIDVDDSVTKWIKIIEKFTTLKKWEDGSENNVIRLLWAVCCLI